MNKIVKKLAVILVAMLVVLTFANISNAASSEFKNVSMSSAQGVKGDVVKIEIKATDNLSIENGGLLLEYDNTKLKYKNSTSGTVQDLMISLANREKEGVAIAVVATSIESAKVTKGTVLATVEFEIIGEKAEDTALKLVYEEEEGHPQLATGKVTISVKPETPTQNEEQTSKTEETTQAPTQNEEQTTETDKQTDTTTTTTNTSKSVGPKTGDMPIVLVSGVMLVALVGIVFIVAKKIKK